MRLVIQRVLRAGVTINGALKSSIDKGLLILVGIEDTDTGKEIPWLASKVAAMRIFDDEQGVMNISVKDCAGEILAVSQFTLLADCRKGNRPSYIHAARPEISAPLYEQFCLTLSKELGRKVETGVFGADMKVELVNDGPVTIVLDKHL